MTSRQCPELRDLQSFASCQLTDEEFNRILEHLGTCQSCEETVSNLERQYETIAEHVPQLAPVPFADEAECQQLMAKIKTGELISAVDACQDRTIGYTPRLVRDYELMELVGQGGMGQVYRAVHQRLKRIVAIKLLNGRLKDQSAIARFEREMAVLGRLEHSHVVRALDAGEHEGLHYLVMEYVDGVDLGDLVKHAGRLPIAEACLAIQQAAFGLQYACERGCVHRDIKPSNLMLAKSGDTAIIKILDLGLARALEEYTDQGGHVTNLTSANQIMGTLDYMAPEQGNDSHDVDVRADIYSLGATLYKLLTGESPHAAHAGKAPIQRLLAMSKNEPPLIQSKRAEVPAPLASIVHRMLARDPDKRFRTPAEVALALEPFCRGADLAWLLNGQSPATPNDSADLKPKAVNTLPPQRTSAIWRLGFAGFALAVLLGVVLHFTTRDGTITIESPDGTLPPDVKIVVSQADKLVAVLQADNHWSLKLANGQYSLQLQGGNDRFELTQSEVTLSRLGRKVITIRVDKSAPPINVLEDAVAKTPELQPQALKPSSKLEQRPIAKPILLVRSNGTSREFDSIHEALDLQKAGDVLEFRTSDRIHLQVKYQPKTRFHLRAAAGFRPMIVFEDVPQDGLGQELIIEGCDLDLRKFMHPFRLMQQVHLSACRVWGHFATISGVKVNIKNSILTPFSGFGTGAYPYEIPSTTLELDNCAIRNRHAIISVGKGNHKLTLRDCTYFVENNDRPTLVEFGRDVVAHVDIDATGCVFHSRSQTGGIIAFDDLSKVTWKGGNNCYSGEIFRIKELVPQENRYELKQAGLDVWMKLLQTEERDSFEARDLRFAWHEMDYGSFPEKLSRIEQAVGKLTPQPQRPDSGPDWLLVGSGAAYARVLQGETNVDLESLQQPGLPDGRIILIRDGQTVRGYVALQEAANAALDMDIIEIRNNGLIPGSRFEGQGRLLTIRAGIGFEPQVGDLANHGSDHLILEGLRLGDCTQLSQSTSPPNWNGIDSTLPLFPGSGGIARIKNCSVDGRLLGWMLGSDGITPEVVNSNIRILQIGLKAGSETNITNSVFQCIGINNQSATSPPPTARITRCATWGSLRNQAYSARGAVETCTPINCEVKDCFLLSSYASLFQPGGIAVSWNGQRNIYSKPYEFGFGATYTLSVDELRKQGFAEPDSFEIPPFEFDPSAWRISADVSPNYHKQIDGTDFGVDVDALKAALTVPVAKS